MTERVLTNVPASVHQRLLNLAKERNEDFGLTLTRYAAERFLYRLSMTPYANNYILKGATLFSIWTGTLHRPTRDMDLAGYGDASEGHLKHVIQETCNLIVEDDGMVYLTDTIVIESIRDDQEYDGLRVQLQARLGNARSLVQIDVGFGDAVSPAPVPMALPALLDMPRASFRTYPMEAVIAEKLHAMTILGITNSRMKDFFDIHTLAQSFPFDGQVLVESIRATFARRSTPLPEEIPLALTTAFSGDSAKQAQWTGFLKRAGLSSTLTLPTAVQDLRTFMEAPLMAAAGVGTFPQQWSAQAGWETLPDGH